MLFGILCFISVIVFLVLYEFGYKSQKQETRTIINAVMFFAGVIILGLILATGETQSDIYPNQSFINNSASVPSKPALESTPEVKSEPQQLTTTYPKDSIQNSQIQQSNITSYNENNRVDNGNEYTAKLKSARDFDEFQRKLEVEEKMRELSERFTEEMAAFHKGIEENDRIMAASENAYNANSYSDYTPTTNIQTYSAPYSNPNANPQTIQVSGYNKKNGTYVESHIRTRANNTVRDNFSYHP
jgi:hypothetical protein